MHCPLPGGIAFEEPFLVVRALSRMVNGVAACTLRVFVASALCFSPSFNIFGCMHPQCLDLGFDIVSLQK